MTGLRLRLATSAIALIGALPLTPQAAFAQSEAPQVADDSGAIIVTAQRRDERSRDVPISVTTLGQDQLAVANVNSLGDTAKLTPALRFDAQGSFVQPTIRGVGTAISTSGGGPNVGIYVDGFFQSNSEVADFSLMKVKSIQVLKGPQGTLFGRNTTGGAILVTTADPSTETGGEFKASYGSFNTLGLQGYATFGLGENVALDVEGMYRRGDSYVRNVATANSLDAKFENWSVRTGLKADLSDSLSVLLRYTHSETNDPSTLADNAFVDATGEAGFFTKVSAAGRAIYGASSSAGLPLVYFYTPSTLRSTAPGTINTANKPLFTNKSDTVQGTIKADLGFADLTSYTQYRRDKAVNNQDLDVTAIPIFFIYIGVDDETVSQEFLLNSKPGSPLQWTAGLNYYQNRDTWDVGANFGGVGFLPFGGSTTTTKSYAAFLDLTYQFSDKLFLTAGGRYSHDVVSDASFTTNFTTTQYIGPTGLVVPFAGLPGTKIPVADLKNDSFTPRIVIRYKPSEESSVYASYTKGYKAGILNVGGLSQLPVKPENINAFEVGYKYDDRTFSFDVAGFYYDYKNLQVSSYQSGAAQIRNAASSEIYGLEAQFRYRVSDAFNVNAGAAWTHARYKSFPNAPYYSYCDPAAVAGDLVCPPAPPAGLGIGALAQTTTDASGYKMQRAPDFTANLGASYGFDLAGGRTTLSGNLYYTSSFYFDPEQQFKQDGYEVLSLRAQWVDPSKRFTLAVYGDNLTNRRYRTQVLFNTLGIGNTWNAPATWGVSAGAKF